MFVPGIELNARFYGEVVAPIVAPWAHSAGLVGWGSDVLGYDTPRSTDHGWGPRLTVFVAPADIHEVQTAVDANLPPTFAGFPVEYAWDEHPLRHHVTVTSLRAWLVERLGCDPRTDSSAVDWLLMPQQRLLEVVRGGVYADGTGELEALRASLAWYPHDVWLWMLAAQWQRVAREEAFVGRAAECGDDLGSRLVVARLARELMRVQFLLAREYWPYMKWFGHAYRSLPGAGSIGAALTRAIAAGTYEERERAFGEALETVAEQHNGARLTKVVDPTTRDYHGRPFRVLHAERFAAACLDEVADPWLRGVPLVGSIDQFADATDVLSYPDRARRLRGIYADDADVSDGGRGRGPDRRG